MLVRFNRIDSQEPIHIDSSKIYQDGTNKIWEYGTRESNDYWKVDDPTLAYLQNAWAHEGMRRVRSDDECGWTYAKPDFYTGIDAIYVEKDDNSRVVWSFNHVKFIPYEMEE
jgi:hypothetical protein